MSPDPLEIERRYRAEVGTPPALPDDDPLAWQWDYRGTKGERVALERGLSPDDLGADEAITEQGALW